MRVNIMMSFYQSKYDIFGFDQKKLILQTNVVFLTLYASFNLISVLQILYAIVFNPLLQKSTVSILVLKACKLDFCCELQHSLHEDVPHVLNALVSLIPSMCSLISTRVGIILKPSSTKPNPGVTGATGVLVVRNNANPRFGIGVIGTQDVEPFLVTVVLQGSPRANQCLPRVTAQ